MEIKFLSAGCGDAIHVHFEGSDKKFHNILIDGGVERAKIYETALRKTLAEISDRNENIDLWIITHIDDDHIGGLLMFIRDTPLFKKFDLSKTRFWYNAWHSDYPVHAKLSSKKSISQAIRLREFLTMHCQVDSFITNELATQDLFGAKLRILSPDRDGLERALQKWRNNEVKIIKKKYRTKKASRPHDYDLPVESFDPLFFEEDRSAENGSSISFMLTYKEKCVLFSADSHPTVIIESLRNLGFSEINKVKLEYFQLSHHGSKFNTSTELMSLLDCNKYIISANGYNHANLPHKEALVRVFSNNRSSEYNFYITHRNSRTTRIFKIDKELKNIQLNFPTASTGYLRFYL